MEREQDLGAMAGLVYAIPLGLVGWTLVIAVWLLLR